MPRPGSLRRGQRCHGGVPTAAVPLAAGTSGGTAGTMPQLKVARDVCPGYPSPARRPVPAIAARDAVPLLLDKKPNPSVVPRPWG